MSGRNRIDLRAILPRAITQPQAVLKAMGLAVKAAWRAEARASLGVSSRRAAEYENALSVVPSDRSVSVVLTGTFPNMLERGMGPGGVGTEGTYDLRDMLLKPGTRNLRHGAGGMYLNVPFSHSADSIKDRGGLSALKAARNLDATRSEVHGGRERIVAWGGALPEGLAPKIRPTDMLIPGPPGPNGQRTMVVAKAHATDPLAGMVRLETQYQGTTKPQSTYRTWRTISENGKAWWHPGIKARRIAERIQSRMPSIIGALFGATGRGGAR